MDWGGDDPLVTELTASGALVYLIHWTDPGSFSYRTTPILPGTYTVDQLRAGMDYQYPNPAAGSATAAK
jgi:hypothetical protein